MKRETAEALCALLGFDPTLPIARCAVVTALDQLPPAAKADIIQHLRFPAPSEPRACSCGAADCVCAIDR